MHNHRRLIVLHILLVLCCQCIISGCTSPIIGLGAAATTAMQDERGFEVVASDLGTKANITALFLKKHKHLFPNINTIVYEGRVLITGSVSSEMERNMIENTVRRSAGVRKILNELRVTKIKRNVLQDNFINLSLANKLVLDSSILSINFATNTVDGIIYLIGIAQSQSEIDRVVGHARNIKSVRQIVNHIILKTDPMRMRKLIPASK